MGSMLRGDTHGEEPARRGERGKTEKGHIIGQTTRRGDYTERGLHGDTKIKQYATARADV